MQSNEIRKKFLEFFKSKGHKILPSASLIPQGDSSVLFTTAGMQPLVPYLLGEPHPMGTRLASAQKCVRTGDIDDIGDNRHLTFFEMLGNWSLGDYFKEESIAWSFEFLTDKNIGLGLDPARLYVTCFEGDESAPRDEESKNIWIKAGIPENRIYFLGKEDNWWGPGDNGPCGPDTEIFYDVTGSCGDLSHDEFLRAQKEEKVIEIWNNVFMEYESRDGKVVGKLAKKNVDTGMGLERITAVVNGFSNVYETDLFTRSFRTAEGIVDSWFDYLKKSQDGKYYNEKSVRIVLDGVRASVFLLAEGIVPNGKDNRGSVLKRIMRKSIVEIGKLGFSASVLGVIAKYFIEQYIVFYPELGNKQIDHLLMSGVEDFEKSFRSWRNKLIHSVDFNKFSDSEKANFLFDSLQSFGIPLEISETEIVTYTGVYVSSKVKDLFHELLKNHQNLSTSASAGMFKGGLANHNEQTIKLHTAHHLLLAALQQVLGPEVKQRGSNITEERLRIDFSFDRKMTDEEKQKVEDLVNEAILKDYKVIKREMSRDEAEKIGAQMEFGAKYGETVSVYFIEDENGSVISKEFCGGPHVEHTGVLGKFKIQKEEASSAGVRRIKAILS